MGSDQPCNPGRLAVHWVTPRPLWGERAWGKSCGVCTGHQCMHSGGHQESDTHKKRMKQLYDDLGPYPTQETLHRYFVKNETWFPKVCASLIW